MESLEKSFPGEKDFCQNTGEMKMTKMKSCFSPKNLERNLSQKYFPREKKKNLRENIFQKFLLQILENPKNFMISFSFPLSLDGKKSSTKFSFSFFPQSVSFFPRVFRFFQK